MDTIKLINTLETIVERLQINNHDGEENEYILECENAISELKSELSDKSVYFIRNIETDEYWDNDMGWVSGIDSASVFSKSEINTLDLPMDGKWVSANFSI